MPTAKSDHQSLTLEELLRAESEVLNRIAHEVEGSNVVAGHHFSHHSAHTSTTSPVERLDAAEQPKSNE